MSLLPAVDWPLVASLGGKWVRPMPRLRAADANIVAELHDAADHAVELVAQASELGVRPKPPVYAIDRATWIEANSQLGRRVFSLIEPERERGLAGTISARFMGALAAFGLATFGRHVLGQYDPFTPGGRLLLVVANIVDVEARFDVDRADFRLWACLHEQTHAVQFASAPWLVEHVTSLLARAASDPGAQWIGKLSPSANAATSKAIDDTMALMMLLEGHADLMMDLAGRDQVATWETLRARFDEARAKKTKKTSAWSKRSGIVSKSAQYRLGAEFCRAVVDEAGIGALNVAFARPDLLPTLDEIDSPASWLARTHGQA